MALSFDIDWYKHLVAHDEDGYRIDEIGCRHCEIRVVAVDSVINLCAGYKGEQQNGEYLNESFCCQSQANWYLTKIGI